MYESTLTEYNNEKKLYCLTEDDDFLRKLWALHTHYLRESAMQKIQFTFSPKDHDLNASRSENETKADLLRQMFWYLLERKVGLFGESATRPGIGIRSGWVVVRCRENKNPIDALMREILGGE